MKAKKIFLLLTLIITLGIAFTIPKKVDAMEKSELITIDADDFTVYVNDLQNVGGKLGGSVQFRYTYNYYLSHGNNTIYVGGYGLNNYRAGFSVYNTFESGYDTIKTGDRLSTSNISFVANSFITNHEFPKSISNVPDGTYDVIIGDDSVNATMMEPGFPTTTYSITIVLSYIIDVATSNPYADYNINDLKLYQDFNFYVYESDHMDGYDEGYNLGTDLGFDTGYTQGYISGRGDYGFYDPNGWIWRDYEYGYASGVLYGELETSSNIFVNGISAYINPDTGVPYIQTNTKDYIQGYAGGRSATAYDIFHNGIYDSVIGYINPATGLPYVASASHDFQQGYTSDSTLAYNSGYNNGYVDGSTTSFMSGIDTWIVPAIIIVLIGGGFIAFAKMRNKGD